MSAARRLVSITCRHAAPSFVCRSIKGGHMRARVPIVALAALLAAVAVTAGAAARPAAPTAARAAGAPADVRAAFFTNWSRYARNYLVKQIPADKLNVLDYAFAAPDRRRHCGLSDPWSDYEAPTWTGDTSVDGVADDPSNPNQHLFGNFNQLLKLKATHPNLTSSCRSAAGRSRSTSPTSPPPPASRQAFVAVVHRPAHQGQPAVRPGAIWPPSGRRPGRGRRRLRRHRHRLGVPRHRSRQRRPPLAGRRPQRDAAAPGVPAPARRVRRRRPASTTS